MKKRNRFSAICAVCGSPATAGSLCDEHYTGQHELFDAKGFDIKVCDGCGGVFHGFWVKENVEDVVRKGVTAKLKLYGKLSKIVVDLRKNGKDYIATVTANGIVPPAKTEKIDEQEVRISVRVLKCPACVKLLGSYHEAVVQIRGDRAEHLLDIFDSVRQNAPMTAERLKYGWNLYFVHKGSAHTLVREVEKIIDNAHEKCLETIRSHKLVGKKDGKHLWRDFYAIR